MKKEITLAETAAAVASSTAGFTIGMKTGVVIGSLFGPPGAAIFGLAGGIWGQWHFMRRTMQSDHPLSQAAKDAARLATGALMHSAELPAEKCPVPADEVRHA